MTKLNETELEAAKPDLASTAVEEKPKDSLLLEGCVTVTSDL